jgi:hypothetical protein
VNDPDIVPLSVAAEWLGVSQWTALRMAEKGDFPGLIDRVRTSGTRRLWKVSVPRFHQEIHGRWDPEKHFSGRLALPSDSPNGKEVS